MDKKSILLIMPYGSVGGMERLALNFYNHYKSLGYNVKGLKFIKLENDIINFGDDELFFKTHDFSYMSKKDRLIFYLKLPKLIKKIVNEYQITHSISFGDMANMFSSLSFSKEYKVGSIHALKSVELKNSTVFNTLTKIGYKTFYRHLNKLVCISKAIKEDLIENCGYRFSNLQVIYNPHDIKAIEKLSTEPIESEEELEIFSKPTVLFLGRLSIQKAPWHLLKAFSILLREMNNVNLVLIGDGDSSVTQYINELVAELNIKPKVHILGRRSNPYKYLRASKALVLSSYYEGTPNVIVESIAVGTPIVSSYCTKGVVELMSLKHHPEEKKNIETESGIIVPNLFKGNLEIPKSNSFIDEEFLLSKAIQQILSDNKINNELSNNQSKLLSKFDINKTTSVYLEKI